MLTVKVKEIEITLQDDYLGWKLVAIIYVHWLVQFAFNWKIPMCTHVLKTLGVMCISFFIDIHFAGVFRCTAFSPFVFETNWITYKFPYLIRYESKTIDASGWDPGVTDSFNIEYTYTQIAFTHFPGKLA